MPYLYKDDIENRYPTYSITSTVIGNITTWELKDADSNLIYKIKGFAVNNNLMLKRMRQNLNISDQTLPCITTTQRDLLTFIIGEQIFNMTLGVAQVKDATGWGSS